jgi:hypothetical protein
MGRRNQRRQATKTSTRPTLGKALDIIAGLPVPRWLPAGTADARQWSRLQQRVKPVERSRFERSWDALSENERRYLQLLGISGAFARFINRGSITPTLLERTRLAVFREPSKVSSAQVSEWFWNGVIAGIALLEGPALRNALTQEANAFDRWGFTPAWCAHKRHWYLRPMRGRKPEACLLHQQAARQARWRASPHRRLEKASIRQAGHATSPGRRRKRRESTRKRKVRAR